MTTAIRDNYLREAASLELADLLAVESKNDEVYTQNIQRFKFLTSLYNETAPQLNEHDLEKIKRVHAQVGFLFLEPGTVPTQPYLQAKRIQYLRIAIEQNQAKLVRKYFRALSIEHRRDAFKMLCNTFGRPLAGEKTSKNGIHLIAKDPRNLLAPAATAPDSARIIDVLVQNQIIEESPELATFLEPLSVPKSLGPATEGKIPLEKIKGFHRHGGKNDYGQTLSGMQYKSKEELLNLKEEEIRWLFPLQKDILDGSFYDEFRWDETYSKNLKRSFEQMLNAYELILSEYGTVRSNRDREKEFENLWQKADSPHYQHIERILESLCLRHQPLAEAFRCELERIYKSEGKDAISEAMLHAWRRAAGVKN